MLSTDHPALSRLPLHEWASLRSELIWIYDREVGARHRQGKGYLMPGYRVWLIRQGSVSITVGRHTLAADAGTWITLPQEVTDHHFSPNAHILSIHFLCQWPSGENILVIRQPIIARSENYPALERDAQKLERLLRRQFPPEGSQEQLYGEQSSDYGSFLRFQGLFINWLAAWFLLCTENGANLTRLSSGDNRPFQAARCLNQASLDRPFPADRLQRETGLGLMRLNQLFFAEFGLTTRKYWDRRRLDFAKQCLEMSSMPMKEISYRLNFRSDSHFVIWFRRQTGSRPSDYRRAYLNRVASTRSLE
jgi:AraC-like DNA-binding protein